MTPSRRLGFALSALLVGTQPTIAGDTPCRPIIAIESHSLAPPFNLRRTWSAKVKLDAARCAVGRGLFSLRLLRTAENAPDLEFYVPMFWEVGQDRLSVEMWIDEAILAADIDQVAECPCRSP